MTQEEIDSIAATAENLRAALVQIGFPPAAANDLVVTSMPAIIAHETGMTRYAGTPLDRQENQAREIHGTFGRTLEDPQEPGSGPPP